MTSKAVVQKKVLVLVSLTDARYHFSAPLIRLIQKVFQGVELDFADHLNSVTEDNLKAYAAVVSFIDAERPDFTDSIADVLIKFVRQGAAHVAVHSAMIQKSPSYTKFIGAEFVMHPPYGSFEVKCRKHPVTAGIKSFRAEDELYLFRKFTKSKKVLFYGVHKNKKCPVAWADTCGKGRMVYFGLGHNRRSYQSREVQFLLTNSLLWAIKEKTLKYS